MAIQAGSRPDGKLLTLGSADPESNLLLRVPQSFQRIVTYADHPLRLTLDCEFSGERIEIGKMLVESSNEYIGSRELTQLRLPQVIRNLAMEVIPDAIHWTRWSQENRTRKSKSAKSRVSDGFLAQLYWFEHVSWGAPRASLMAYLGCSRTTANSHIKRIALEFPLPGSHWNPKYF
jgi:hypothetical protein